MMDKIMQKLKMINNNKEIKSKNISKSQLIKK